MINTVRQMPPTIVVHCCPWWRLDSNLFPHLCWNSFTPFSVNVVTDASCRLLDKWSAADLIPTNVLKWISDQIVPFIMSLYNCSLASGGSGQFAASFKVVSVTHVPKKSGLDPADAGSYRPISNLSVLSKLLERLVVRQLLLYLLPADLLPPL